MKTRNKNKILQLVCMACFCMLYNACKLPSELAAKKENKNVPLNYSNKTQDTTNTAAEKWKDFFTDPNLRALIDTALKNNQELNIILREIQIAQTEVRARKGEYLPFLDIDAGAGVEKVGRYTRNGAVEANEENAIHPGNENPEPLPDFLLSARLSWQVDIWKKLRNAKKSAMLRYLATTEGKNFMVTNLIAEIAHSYYELLAYDNQLDIVKQNITIQSNALQIVKLEKESARVTELAVRKFEAEVFHTKSLQYDIQQNIIEMENRINFLVGRFPQPIQRNTNAFTNLAPDTVQSGIPAQLLQNRPDIRQAELELEASRLDVKVAKANFYPTLNLSAGIGLNAFNPSFLIKSPQSMLYSLAGDLVAPLINRNAIKAFYYSASAKQVQAAYNYERAVLRAYIEVVNQLSNIDNLAKSYDFKSKQVEALNQSINISIGLFKSARADYMEILLTQRDALDSKFELIDTKKQQMDAMVNMYQALGGGWR